MTGNQRSAISLERTFDVFWSCVSSASGSVSRKEQARNSSNNSLALLVFVFLSGLQFKGNSELYLSKKAPVLVYYIAFVYTEFTQRKDKTTTISSDQANHILHRVTVCSVV